jgi:hypothetical protein
MKKIVFFCFFFAVSVKAENFLDQFVNLKAFLREDSVSFFRVGFGVVPFRGSQQKAGLGLVPFSASLFTSFLDWNFLSTSVGYGFLGSDNATNFISVSLKTALKWRFSSVFSLGPVVGIEFVSYPFVSSRIFKNHYATPYEPFSVAGPFFGGVLSEVFSVASDSWIQLNQMVFIQKYRIQSLADGWTHVFEKASFNKDSSSLNPGLVFLIEVCLLF